MILFFGGWEVYDFFFFFFLLTVKIKRLFKKNEFLGGFDNVVVKVLGMV
jgi:hypothetical protein